MDIILCGDGNLLCRIILCGVFICVSERAVFDRRLDGVFHIAAADARPHAGAHTAGDAVYVVVQMLRILRTDESLTLIVTVDDRRFRNICLGCAPIEEGRRTDTDTDAESCGTAGQGECIQFRLVIRGDGKTAHVHLAVHECGACLLLHAHKIIRVRDTKFVSEAKARRERGDALRGACRDGGVLCRDDAAYCLCLSRAIDQIDAGAGTDCSALSCDGDGTDECAAVCCVVRTHGYVRPVSLCCRVHNPRCGRAADDVRIDCSGHRRAHPCTAAIGNEGVRRVCRRGGDGDAAIRIFFASRRQTVQTCECADGQRRVVEFVMIQTVLDLGRCVRILRMGNNLRAGV